MPPPDRRGKAPERPSPKPKEKELRDLRKLFSFVSTPFAKTAGSRGGGRRALISPQENENGRNVRFSSTEAVELDNFSVKFREQRHFCDHPHHTVFLEIFTSLIKNRLNCSEWMKHSSPTNIVRVLICLRLFIREPRYQIVFYELNGLNHLVKYMESVSRAYLQHGERALETEQLVTMTYLCQKLAMVDEQRKWLVGSEAHKTLVKLLAARDSNVLLGALLALTTLADSSECKENIGELCVVESLLVILQEYDTLSKRLSAELLRLLCPVPAVREQLCQCDAVPVLLSMLHADHLKLLWSTVWVLVQLCQDPEGSANIRAWGGVQQLLRLLNGSLLSLFSPKTKEQVYVSDRSSIATLSSANAAGRLHKQHVCEDLSPHEAEENTFALHAACCAAITELVLDDTAAHHVVQENGVYIISKLILPQGPKAASLQFYAFRTLRFLFSMERNRHLFKRLFTPELFEMFIDIGHYVRDIAAYEPLQEKINLLSTEDLDGLKERIDAVNQNRPPLKVINGYAILDHLGSGAFGSVYKVRKQGAQNCLALKEVNLHNPAFGQDKKSRDSNVDKIVSELTIIREQMAHPNIVKYLKTFLECDRLYVVMELVEGAPLAEHFSSLKEKRQTFTEERVWNIFIQMCLALRYLHKEKRIVHRDLTPNNIMLGERDKVTITDFGLAKQKQENSKLMSVVGTILYSCPEIVKNEPYGEKADVWAAGCVLYQMVTLKPPFYSSNMLSLATKIVEAAFEPVEDAAFSERVTDMIQCCLTPNADMRPDIVEVSSRICDLIMTYLDDVNASHSALERRAERDRRRAQKYCIESNRMKLVYCRTAQGLDFKDQLLVDQNGQQSEKRDLHFSSSADEEVQAHDSARNPDSASLPDEQSRAGGDFMKSKARPGSAGICVSHRKVRQIDDPNLRLLELLHKIIFITQLPPEPQSSFQRRLIERFKRSLFQRGSSSFHLKVELSKVLQGGQELVEPLSARKWWSMLHGRQADTHGDSGSFWGLEEGITYEQVKIEEVLESSGYYSTASFRSDSEMGSSRTVGP
ncbi:serine/threonine-protein kinase Nek10 isoform X2 [Trichomycterus rosablanca]|uniref:serine/threonine-protein kinase Nek10 isoform X2 n=1 Tax=Trichomycterus rosablanca TaxID=2290929 RepID=UPI002F360426